MNTVIYLLLLYFSLFLSLPLLAQYTAQQSHHELEVLSKLKQLDGLDLELVYPTYLSNWQQAAGPQQQLSAVYDIITLAPPMAGETKFYLELSRLATKLNLTEYQQIAELYLLLNKLDFDIKKSKQSLLNWRANLEDTLTNRVKSHYLWLLSKVDRSPATMQQIMQHYLELKQQQILKKERFLLLNAMRYHDQILEQKRTSSHLAFDYALKYQFPIDRNTYLYNQIILLIDNAEYALALSHAEFYLSLASKLDNQVELFFANQLNGYVLLFSQDYQNALQFIETAEQFQAHVTQRWRMQNQRFKARALLHLGDLEQAKLAHQQDAEYLLTAPPLDTREFHFHQLNQGYILLLQGQSHLAIDTIENTFYRAYSEIISERNDNVSKIRELANKELDAKMQAKANQKSLLLALTVLALFFILTCISLIHQIRLRKALQLSRDHAVAISRTDSLTQLNTRQFFQQRLTEEFNRLTRYSNSPACLLMLDVDNFKAINDTYGHLAGDLALITVGKVIKQRTRASDVSGRCGGEEFIILLPETTQQEAYVFAESLRQTMATATTQYQSTELQFTTSIGIAAFTTELDSISQWIDQADKAMYQAKTSGRNKVVCYDPNNAQ